jgi:hypothetical protein
MINSQVDLDTLINNFRLLELAGAADRIANESSGAPEAHLWREYAQAARNYHSWISAGDFNSGALLGVSDAAGNGRIGFFTRIVSEIGSWTPENSFQGSYLHFLGAYEAMVSLDGERMIRELKAVVERLDPNKENRSLDGARAYFAAEDSNSPSLLDEVLSSYQAMQVVADVLGPALGLERHAFDDIQRFALRPGFAETQARPPG